MNLRMLAIWYFSRNTCARRALPRRYTARR